jgi:dienelactone hydrolase
MKLPVPNRCIRFCLAAFFLAALGWSNPALAAAGAVRAKKAPKNSADSDPFSSNVAAGKKFVYKHSGGAPRELEVYYPPNWRASGPAVPGVILFHGGGWSGGNLQQFRYACQYLASRGLVAATANYRMLTKAEREKLPAGESNKRVCVTDAKSAIRWMKQHAAELGIDPQRLITGGGSAGGHVSVLATLNPGLNDPQDPREFDTRVAAYLLFNPAFRASDSSDAEIDVLRHLDAGMAPAIFFFGTDDATWKPGSDALLAGLKARGGSQAELWLGEGQAHGFFNRPPWQDVTLAEADRFLARLGFLRGAGTLSPPASGEKLGRAP